MNQMAYKNLSDKEETKVYIEIPKFSGANVPVAVAAKVMKKDRTYITQGLINGKLKFGEAMKKEGSSQYDYYISPKLFWEYTGYIYEEEKD